MKKEFFYILWLLPWLVMAQLQRQVAFSKLSVDDGLSQNSVVSIAQDATGYLWFATQDGLNKYDGNTFTYYPKFFEDITQKTFSKLGKVFAGPNGAIYLITLEGNLEIFDPETETFHVVEGVESPSTLHLDKGYLWLGTYGNGLYKIKPESGDTIQVFKGWSVQPMVYDISSFRHDVYVAGSGGVYTVDLNTHNVRNLVPSEQRHVNFSSIAHTAKGELWVGSYGSGLFYKDQETETISRFKGFDNGDELPTDLNIQALLMDLEGRLWIGTYGDGAYRIDFELNTIQNYKVYSFNPRSISYNDVLSLHQDRSGVIWLGTDGGGLSYYDENLFKFNEITNSTVAFFAKVDVARAISIDDNGDVWIGTSGKGLTQYFPKHDKSRVYTSEIPEQNPLPSNRIMSLMNHEGRMWVGFQDAGLAVIEGNRVTTYNSESNPPIPARTVWCLHEDVEGNAWLGTRENGLIQFSSQTGVVRKFTVGSSGLPSNNVRVIEKGPNGTLWVGTEDKGFFKFNPQTEEFIETQRPDILQIKSLYYSSPLLWIGTNGKGLHAIHEESGKHYNYTIEDGLPNNVIYGILPGPEGELWLSSNRGLTAFDGTKSLDRPSIVNYDVNDGLQAMEFNTGASFRSNDGTLYFGGLNGVNWFQPTTLESNAVPPQTVINKLELFTEELPLKTGQRFKATDNTLSFTFAALHFSEPESNQYQYILGNYEEDWSKPSTNNYAHYPKLPPGDYSFKVRSSNYENVWDETPAVYNFTIKRPWYLSIVARFGYLLLTAFVLWSVYRYLKWRWNIQMELQLEHDEAERLRNLDELKSKLYTNISHEFRTPLTLISAPIQQLLNSSEVSEKDQRSLRIIEGSSQRMLRLVNQLLDLSKLEKGAVQLQVGAHQLKPQIVQLLEAFQLKANESGIKLKTKIDDFGDSWYDRDVMEKIISNLLSNAVKYAPENSEIEFSALKENGHLWLKTVNENSDISEKQIEKLFDRFFQADKNSHGVGVGLALIKELSTLSNGMVKAEKEHPETISFYVQIPISKENYNANSIVKEKAEYSFIDSEASVDSIFDTEADDTPQILVVEDNLEIRAYVASLFSENYVVAQAKDGLEGIKMAIEKVPDLIISDIMMPKKDGIELCNTLKSDTRTSHIPIILLTAKSGDYSELEGLQNKADDYIVKPFNAEVLKQKAVNIIASRRALRERYSQNVFLKPKDIAFTSVDETFLEEVQKVLDSSITDPDFNAERFAASLYMSRMQLHRKIKALTSLSTTEFIRSQRLKSAIRLIEDSGMTVNEIAYSVGFNTPSYFIKCFKQAYGVTPSEYNK
ncbi:MAG: two-component regulator propeller domain-containing protein [Bacteroidota bacterium]